MSIFNFVVRQIPYFAQSVTPGSLCHGKNLAQMPTLRGYAVVMEKHDIKILSDNFKTVLLARTFANSLDHGLP